MEIQFEKYKPENIRNQNYSYMCASGSFHTIQIKTDNNLFTILSNDECIYVEKIQNLKPILDKKKNQIKIYCQENQMAQIQHCFTIKNQDFKIIQKFQDQLIDQINYYKFKGPLSFEPCSQNRSSALSTESPNQNYRGFMNLFIIILISANVRIIFENYMKYGILLKFIDPFVYLQAQGGYETIIISIILSILILLAYLIEKLSLKKNQTESLILTFNIVNILMVILIPYFYVTFYKPHPGIGMLLLTLSIILACKLISYAHVLRNMRLMMNKIKLKKKNQDYLDIIGENELSHENYLYFEKYLKNYDNILKLQDLIYFMFAPTLCFQFQYPRTTKIRKIWLIKRIIELFLSIMILTILLIQYIEPLILNFNPHNTNLFYRCERLLRLALPNTYCWIVFFFIFFHLYLNILSELLYFADRKFYTDWWNCKNLGEYWRQWNLPVHFFMLRHVYNPLLKRGVSKSFGMFIVFFISAFLHEYLISASIGVWSFWAFLAMMIQMPIIIIQNSLKNLILKESQLGNVLFWVSFCIIGQPMCLFVYYQIYIENKL